MSSATKVAISEDFAKGRGFAQAWEATGQPLPSLSIEEYVQIATQAHSQLERELIAFCERNKLSYVAIPHARFRTDFETSTSQFREWFESYCKANKENENADVMIVTSVKTLERAKQKYQFNPIFCDKNKDFLRGMIVALSGHGSKKHKQSLGTLNTIIKAMRNDERTIAENDLFSKPKENGFRGYKAAWQVDVPEGKDLADVPMMTSIKIQHESQMDVDKTTRKLGEIIRQTEDSLSRLYRTCADSETKPRTTSMNFNRTKDGASSLKRLGVTLYDYIHAQNGLNELLSLPYEDEKTKLKVDLQKRHKPLTLTQLAAAITDCLDGSRYEATLRKDNLIRSALLLAGGAPKDRTGPQFIVK